ncbi:MAG: hypothetical protein IKH76_02165 [Clostridiales bacterium]|nr:hypothetical protein [Clostridiales bacterium]
MDYLEGLFLGKLWSDTDFENRRHMGLFVLYGLLVVSVVVFNFFFGRMLLGIGSFGVLQIVLFALLFLACPFICFRYYRMPMAGKIIILIEKLFKSYLVMSFTVGQMMRYIRIPKAGLQDYIINYLNSTLESYTEQFAASAGSFATVLAVLAGGIHVVLVFALVIIAAIVIPGVIYLLFVFLQRGYDWLISRFVIKRVFPTH